MDEPTRTQGWMRVFEMTLQVQISDVYARSRVPSGRDISMMCDVARQTAETAYPVELIEPAPKTLTSFDGDLLAWYSARENTVRVLLDEIAPHIPLTSHDTVAERWAKAVELHARNVLAADNSRP